METSNVHLGMVLGEKSCLETDFWESLVQRRKFGEQKRVLCEYVQQGEELNSPRRGP